MTEKTLEIGALSRDQQAVQIIVERSADQPVRLSFPASSEMAVERWFGTEILSHAPGAIRMDRLQGGAAPLLFNHDWNDPVGMIDAARVKDGRLWVDAHLFATARAAEVAQMIDGGLRNVSIGYELHQVEENTKANTYTARDWGVLEVSVVTVPADPGVGIGRNADTKPKPVQVILRTEPTSQPTAAKVAAQPKESTVDNSTTPIADANPQARLSALDAEMQRRQAVRNLCKANKIDARVEAGWVEDGTPLEKIAEEVLTVMEERGRNNKTSAAMLGLSNRETQRYSLFKAIRALKGGHTQQADIAAAAFEIECSREVAKQLGRADTGSMLVPTEVLTRPIDTEAATRAMSASPGSKGGYMVSVDNMGFIDILRNRSVAMSMGARVLSGLQGNVSFARQTGKPSVTWQAGENVSVTAADQTLGQLSMTPKTAIVITDVSEQLLRQSSPSAEAFVMADLAKVIAIDGVDNAVINGTGGAQPLGIKNTTGISSGQDAGTVTYAKLLAFVSTAAGSNAILDNPGFVTNAAGAAVLMQKQRFSSTDTPLWTGNILDGQAIGFRAMASEQLASQNLIFGSWGQVVIGEWGVLELSTDNGGTRFNTATVGIRAMWMVDVLLRYPQAFVVSTSLTA